MARCIPASWGTFFLLSVGLHYINATEEFETPIYYVVKPSLWGFPALELRIPFWLAPTAVLEPSLVLGVVRELDEKRLSLALSVDHRDCSLTPNFPEPLLCPGIHRSPHARWPFITQSAPVAFTERSGVKGIRVTRLVMRLHNSPYAFYGKYKRPSHGILFGYQL